MSTTFEGTSSTNPVQATRYVGPAGKLDRRRVVLHVGVKQLDITLEEARALYGAFAQLLGDEGSR
jgi:hypothetical protein